VPASYSNVEDVLVHVLEPLIRQDGGELFLVHLDQRELSLHLRGEFSGCPGNTLAIRRVIEPAVSAVAPRLKVNVTSGELLPPSAKPVRQTTA
jgi:Fe-S cluster biogenesis protein NfuA